MYVVVTPDNKELQSTASHTREEAITKFLAAMRSGGGNPHVGWSWWERVYKYAVVPRGSTAGFQRRKYFAQRPKRRLGEASIDAVTPDIYRHALKAKRVISRGRGKREYMARIKGINVPVRKYAGTMTSMGVEMKDWLHRPSVVRPKIEIARAERKDPVSYTHELLHAKDFIRVGRVKKYGEYARSTKKGRPQADKWLIGSPHKSVSRLSLKNPMMGYFADPIEVHAHSGSIGRLVPRMAKKLGVTDAQMRQGLRRGMYPRLSGRVSGEQARLYQSSAGDTAYKRDVYSALGREKSRYLRRRGHKYFKELYKGYERAYRPKSTIPHHFGESLKVFDDDKIMKIKHHIRASYKNQHKTKRELARIIYGRLRKLGWRPKRELHEASIDAVTPEIVKQSMGILSRFKAKQKDIVPAKLKTKEVKKFTGRRWTLPPKSRIHTFKMGGQRIDVHAAALNKRSLTMSGATNPVPGGAQIVFSPYELAMSPSVMRIAHELVHATDPGTQMLRPGHRFHPFGSVGYLSDPKEVHAYSAVSGALSVPHAKEQGVTGEQMRHWLTTHRWKGFKSVPKSNRKFYKEMYKGAVRAYGPELNAPRKLPEEEETAHLNPWRGFIPFVLDLRSLRVLFGKPGGFHDNVRTAYGLKIISAPSGGYYLPELKRLGWYNEALRRAGSRAAYFKKVAREHAAEQGWEIRYPDISVDDDDLDALLFQMKGITPSSEFETDDDAYRARAWQLTRMMRHNPHLPFHLLDYKPPHPPASPATRELQWRQQRRKRLPWYNKHGMKIGENMDVPKLSDKLRKNIRGRELKMGMNVELEHGKRDPDTNVSNDDPVTTAKIAIAHLREIPDYYTRLDKMEKQGKKAMKKKVHSEAFDRILSMRLQRKRQQVNIDRMRASIKKPIDWSKPKMSDWKKLVGRVPSPVIKDSEEFLGADIQERIKAYMQEALSKSGKAIGSLGGGIAAGVLAAPLGPVASVAAGLAGSKVGGVAGGVAGKFDPGARTADKLIKRFNTR